MRKLAMVVAALVAGVAATFAFASEQVLCTLAVTTTAGVTSSPTTGTCSWANGAIVAIQCPSTVIHYDARPGGTATTSDILVDFTANPDPYLIDLRSDEKVLSVRTATGTGTCVFASTVK